MSAFCLNNTYTFARFSLSLDGETEYLWTCTGTFGVFGYQSYDEWTMYLYASYTNEKTGNHVEINRHLKIISRVFFSTYNVFLLLFFALQVYYLSEGFKARLMEPILAENTTEAARKLLM